MDRNAQPGRFLCSERMISAQFLLINSDFQSKRKSEQPIAAGNIQLAEIYGYTTSAFNQQVKNNIAKFDDDFRFQLSHEELDQLSMPKNSISIQTKGVKGGRSKFP